MTTTLSLPLFSALVALVGLMRLLELARSRRNRRALQAGGARPVTEPHFRAMVLVHVSVLAGALLEAWITRRAPAPALAASMLLLVLGANALRLWVIATLGAHWNVAIMDSIRDQPGWGVVTAGPYRLVRHPNYVAVFVELCALPLVHAAYFTAALGAAAHLLVLYHRIRAEEEVLLAHAEYRAAMGDKPRFLPRLAAVPAPSSTGGPS
jgi:methyltransferase